jgi:ribonucleoside-diphosphate reductase alpha chain
MDCFGTAVSMSLQYGVPLEVYVNKFSHTRFEPMGYTKNPDIRIAKSLVDYIFRWLGMTFLAGYREASLGSHAEEGTANKSSSDAETESGPAAKKAGGLNGGQGATEKSAATKGPDDKLAADKSAFGGPPSNGPAKDKPASGPAGKVSLGASAKLVNGHGAKPALANAALLERAGAAMKIDQNGGTFANRTEQFASFQTDAPSCDNCGAITVRNGNCYLCHNCGNSMGCS